MSLALHLFLGLLCFFLISQRTAIHPRQLTWIEVEPATPEAVKKAQDAFKNRHRIVQTEKGEQIKTAAPDAFLGEHTQTVDRETVNANRTTVIGKAQTPAKTAGDSAHKRSVKAKAVAQAAPALPIVGNLGVQIVPKETKPQSDQETAREENWADQASSAQDYVRGMKESNRTLLNTKEYVFFGYYQRIRQRLDRAWVPILHEKLLKYYNSGRHLASEMEHTTKVVVVLDTGGEITAVRVVSESGTRDLDDAAVSAFNQAGPFPNPPHGIVGSNGLIEIPWEFILRT